MESFRNLVENTINMPEPNYTPAQTPLINNLKNHMTHAVNTGLDPAKIVKLTGIMCLIIERGIKIEDIQNHNNLFLSLCTDSDFSVMDHNIDHIVNQMNAARNA